MCAFSAVGAQRTLLSNRALAVEGPRGVSGCQMA